MALLSLPLVALMGFSAPQAGGRLHAATRPVVMSVANTLTAWQPGTLAKLVEGLGLQPKTYAADLGFDSFSIDGMSGAILSYEAPGKSNVAWCSALSMSDGASNARCSITAWCGPLSDVPHLIASASASNGGINLFIDFRPRADCAYNPSGEYEEPASREAFAMSGNRKDFASAFYTDEMLAWRASLLALEGAVGICLLACWSRPTPCCAPTAAAWHSTRACPAVGAHPIVR